MQDLIGIGLYDRTEAARLTGAKPSTIARWLTGYTTRSGVKHEPMWRPDVEIEGELTLSFRDLMELRAALAFKGQGLSTQMIRKAIRKAEEIIGLDHPFSTTRFRTDGASIMVEVEPEEGEPRMLDIFRNQYVIKAVIEQSLKDVVFDGMRPIQWRPCGASGGILIDPAHAFGQPVEESCFVPTRTLADAVDAESGDLARISQLYEVPLGAVRRAVKFEREHAAAA